MKELTLTLLVVSVVGISGYLIKVPTTPSRTAAIGSRGWVHIQKLMLPLFDNVCEESTDPIIVRLAKEFTLNGADFTDPNVITELKNLQTEKGLLPRGEIFSEFESRHWNELEAIYKVMYYAKDFDTFYNVTAWARQNVNCGLFVDAIFLAILNRRETSKLSLPALYELMPNYFISKDVIIKGSNILAGEDATLIGDVKDEGNTYVIDANYTANVNDNEDDAKLAYFREDIGLNSYYFLRKLRLAPWLNVPSDLSNNYGESMYQMMKQFAARYDLERYANALPELESIDWDSEVKMYDPMLIYSNGNEFDHRIFDNDISGRDEIELLKSIENNIPTVVSHMRQSGYNKGQILNNLVEIFVTSNKNYETMARRVLGSSVDATQRQYSVLEHLMTTLRDPVFWRLNKRIVEIIDSALSLLPAYSRNELYFPGVQILNIEIKKMLTQFDSFQFDVTDSLKITDDDTNFQVKINLPRLSHKQFVIKLNISSLVTQKGLVKLYLGPKLAPGELAANKNLFVLLDVFDLNLKIGSNIVSRSSEEMTSFSKDFISLRNVRKSIEDAEFGLNSLSLSTIESQIGYPDRLILPKGTSQGLPLQIFAFVAPFTKAKMFGSGTSSEFNSAILSPGYPLDLSLEDHQLFNLPNSLIKDITVTHKGSENAFTGGESKKYGGGRPYDPSSRPTYGGNKGGYNQVSEDVEYENYEDNIPTYSSKLLSLRPEFTKRKQPEDYNSKRGQYGNQVRKNTIDENGNHRVSSFRDAGKAKLPETTYRKIRPSYDYSSKKGNYEGKDYSEKRENIEETTDEVTTAADSLMRVDLQKDIIVKDDNLRDKYKVVSNEDKDYMAIVKEGKKVNDNFIHSDEQPTPQWGQFLTLFDIIPAKEDDSDIDEKVYE